MTQTQHDFLFEVEPPYISVGRGEVARSEWISQHFYSRPGLNTCVRRVRGKKMLDSRSLMNEFAAAFQFFDGFGENWYALQDCLSYLDEWLPADGYVIVVEDAEATLADDLDALPWLLTAVNNAAKFWATPITDNDRFNRPARPFHMLLNIGDSSRIHEHRNRFTEASKKASAPLRFI